MKLSDARFVLLDTETTDPQAHLVVELAALRWRANAPMAPEDLRETMVNPGCKLHPASQAIHHIRNEDVATAPRLVDIAQEWADWVGDDIIVAYNSDYDKGVLAHTPLNDKVWMDAYRMAMHFWSLGQLNDDGFPLTTLKQQELRYWLDLPPSVGDAHRAGADVQVTAHFLGRVIDLYLQCGNPDSLDAFVAYINGPICHDVIPLGGRPYSGKNPSEVEDWALKKAFDPKSDLFVPFAKFNVHDCLRPEYIKRFGNDPTAPAKPAPKQPTRPPASVPAAQDQSASSGAPDSSGTSQRRWVRR